jgi:hypothetical protein
MFTETDEFVFNEAGISVLNHELEKKLNDSLLGSNFKQIKLVERGSRINSSNKKIYYARFIFTSRKDTLETVELISYQENFELIDGVTAYQNYKPVKTGYFKSGITIEDFLDKLGNQDRKLHENSVLVISSIVTMVLSIFSLFFWGKWIIESLQAERDENNASRDAEVRLNKFLFSGQTGEEAAFKLYGDIISYTNNLINKKSRGVILYGMPGTGKCLGRGTPVLLLDGTVKAVEDIVIGDILMGPDSCGRKVLSTTVGFGKLYKVIPTKGDSYIVNDAHILSLFSDKFSQEPINISIKEFLSSNENFQKNALGWRIGVEFKEKNICIEPYSLGVLLDKLDKSISNKTFDRIPVEYLTNTKNIRLQLLAGLLDSCNQLTRDTYQYTTTLKILANDFLFLCRSLGFAAYKEVIDNSNFKITITGNLSEIPIKTKFENTIISENLTIVEDVLKTNITLEELDDGEYFGFELDGDGLFLLGDFTVTHNTYIVRRTLHFNKLVPEVDYAIVKGSTAKVEDNIKIIYSTLYKYNGKIIVFDDFDSALSDINTINLLKAALDSYPVRIISMPDLSTYSASSQPLPKKFEFSGRIIMITNMSKIDTAILSRTQSVALNFSTHDFKNNIEAMLKFINPEIDMKIKEEVYDYLHTSIIKNPNVTLDMRRFSSMVDIRMAYPHTWKELCKDVLYPRK